MATKTVLITGSTGQLGQSFQAIQKQYSDVDFTFVNRELLDLSDPESITAYFQHNQFDVIINCAAHTAVDKAESEPELAEQINHIAVRQLAEIAKHSDCKLIHISTDYVFNGKSHRPYIESDGVEPQGVYGKTKLAGEQAIEQILSNNALVIRTSWVYSEFGNNFVKTMRRLGGERDALNVIFDQVGTPTYAKDLATAIMSIVTSPQFELQTFTSQTLHFSNEGVCSWYDFAKAIFELSHISCDVSPIETKDYPTPATRPHYSVLNKAKIKDTFQLTIPYWKDSLQQCLTALQDLEK